MNTPATAIFDSKSKPEGPVQSPCVSVCRMSPATGLCMGCLRTLGEIAAWGQASDDDKRAVWAQIEVRRATTAKPSP
jgi:uncharacterized protein